MLKVKTSTRREAEAVARGGVSREACKSTEHTSMSGSVSRPKIPFSGPALHLQLAVSLVHMSHDEVAFLFIAYALHRAIGVPRVPLRRHH